MESVPVRPARAVIRYSRGIVTALLFMCAAALAVFALVLLAGVLFGERTPVPLPFYPSSGHPSKSSTRSTF